MPTIGSIVNNGQGQLIARVPGGAPGTETYLVRRINGGGNAPAEANSRSDGATAASSAGQLSPAEKRIIAELQARDRAVRNEEERHANTAGQYAGEPQYTYRRGPDGKLYAVEGRVPIRLGNAGSSPEEQEKALRRVQAAAVSVQLPSSGDFRAIAGAATSLAAQENGETITPAERRQEAERAYRDAQRNAAATEDAANLARELFGAIADQRI
jgi:hypothetical protein